MDKTKNALIIEGGFAELAFPGGDRLSTARLAVGKPVTITPSGLQLCKHKSDRVLTYKNPEQMARDCNAVLYKTQQEFINAVRELHAITLDQKP